MERIIDYYNQYDEASRLTTDFARRLEFVTTTHYLDKYLGDASEILDLGAGSGIYTFYYAEQGHRILSTDLTPKHVQQIQQQIDQKGYSNVNAAIVNAVDLSGYDDAHFDAVFCLGPMYHLTDALDQTACIKECLRVLKPGGLLAVAYVNRMFIFHHLVRSSTQYLDYKWMERILQDKQISGAEEDCFWTDAYFHTPGEIEALIEPYGVQKLEHVATDGMSILLSDTINALSTEQFKLWTDYHLQTCSEPSTLGISNHGMYIGRKAYE